MLYWATSSPTSLGMWLPWWRKALLASSPSSSPKIWGLSTRVPLLDNAPLACGSGPLLSSYSSKGAGRWPFTRPASGRPTLNLPDFFFAPRASYLPSCTRVHQPLTRTAATWGHSRPVSNTVACSSTALRGSSLPLDPSAGRLAFETCLDPASTATEGEVQEHHNGEDLSYTVNEPEGPRVLGGVGPPRCCQQLDYCDGGGLCLPGRWKPENRSLASGPSWDWLREKTLDLVWGVRELERGAFRMAAGGEHGCSLAKNEKLQSQLRQLWKDWLEAQDLGEKA